MLPVSICRSVRQCQEIYTGLRGLPTFKLLAGDLSEVALLGSGSGSLASVDSSSGRALRGSSSPSRSVKTVLVSEVDGEGAVMSISDGVAGSPTERVADRWFERSGGNLPWSDCSIRTGPGLTYILPCAALVLGVMAEFGQGESGMGEKVRWNKL